jgi:hypothetical protein
VIGEGEDGLELPVDRLGEPEGIEAIAERHEGGDLGMVAVGAGEHPLEGGAGGVVTATHARADALLADQLDGGQEEVLEEAELAAVEGVDRREGGGRVVAEVAEQLADVGPILCSMWALSSVL